MSYLQNPFEGNAPKREPISDPTSRLIHIRGMKSDKVHMEVPAAIQEFFSKLLNHIGKRSDWFATCITCFHWDKESRSCNKFHSVPPPEIIADGCEHYEDEDQIPF
jgi:hypothetical protein